MSEFAYVARNERGTFAVARDLPESAKETAKDVARWIRAGAQVERIPLKQAVDELNAYIEADMKAKESAPATRRRPGSKP